MGIEVARFSIWSKERSLKNSSSSRVIPVTSVPEVSLAAVLAWSKNMRLIEIVSFTSRFPVSLK